MADSEATSAAEMRREVADRLLAIHGPTFYGYGIAMLGERGATTVFVSLFDYVEEHHATLAEASEEDAMLALHAVAYNRCIEHARSGVGPSVGDGLIGDERRAMEVLVQLKPVGRDALLRRWVAGTRWGELQRICGAPRMRMHMRVCRALRRVASLDGSSKGESPSVDPSELEDGWRWSAIRRSAVELVAFRRSLRRLCERWATPPDAWRGEIWGRLDETRDARRRADEAARTPSPEPEEVESSESEDDESVDSPGVVESSVPAPSSPRSVEPERRPSSMSGRMLAGLALALGALAVLWLWMR